MKKIIVLCHGNICRSPMGEYLLKHLVKEAGREGEFEITSGAVSMEEIGNDIYPPAKRKLTEKGIPFSHHSAHRITPREFEENDLVIIMDNSNMRILERIIPQATSAPVGKNLQESGIEGKVHMMMEFAGHEKGKHIPDVADPWYTGDFEQTYRDLLAGCRGLLELI